METQTIQQIKEQIDQAKQALKDFVPKEHKEERYGPEQEYTPQSLKAGLQAVLADFRGLVKAHNKFIQISTYDERNTICNHLANIINSLENEDYGNTATFLDLLKLAIRNYSTRGSSETQEILEERVNRLSAQCSVAEEYIDATEKIQERAEQVEEKLQSTEEKIENFDNTLIELKEKSEQILNLQSQSEQNNQAIIQSLASAQNHEGSINDFVQKIITREQQLEEQGQATTSYKEQLTSFEKNQKENIAKADELIKQARNALEYTTAAGISASFTERYSSDKREKSWWWLIGSAVFVAFSIGIGIWWLFLKQDSTLAIDMSRIAVMFASFSGAWFCASQYVKHKNIQEDYGYKSVLAKSMVAFFEQLPEDKKGLYLEIVLAEIHRDPMRTRHDAYDSPGQGLLGKLLGTGNQKNVNKQG